LPDIVGQGKQGLKVEQKDFHTEPKMLGLRIIGRKEYWGDFKRGTQGSTKRSPRKKTSFWNVLSFTGNEEPKASGVTEFGGK